MLTTITNDGKFTLNVILNDGTKLDAVEFFLVDSNISWTPEAGCENGKKFSTLPKTLSYTLSNELPQEGKYTAGLMLASSIPFVFNGWDIAVPCTVEGTNVTFDFSALNGEDSQKIIDAGVFTPGLKLANKDLTANYTIEVRMQPFTLGYCSSEFTTNDTYVGANSASSGVGAAIRIPAAKLETMKGGTINKLRIGMGPGMERVYAWIRPALNKPAIMMKAMDTTVDGWQEIEFDTPYIITGEEIYIGYSGYQPSGIKAIRCGGNDREDGCWLSQRDTWEDCSAMGYGTLYIQAIGEAVLPGADLGMDNVRIDKQYYKSGETVKANFTVLNSGGQDINSYNIFWSINDNEPVETVVNTTLATDSGADFTFDIPLTDVHEGIHSLTIGCAITAAGVQDEVESNNTVEFTLPVYETTYPRTVLMENFTTARCTNCPNGHTSIHNAIEGTDDTAWLCHHVGFGTDDYTIEQSNAFLDFDVLGAPSLMLDRTIVTAPRVPFTIGYTNTEAGGKTIAQRIDICRAIPAFASLNVTNDYNVDTRELTIHITGERNAIFSILNPDCNYTVFLTESGLMGYQEGYSNVTGQLYSHDNVIRSIETPTFGEPVEWDGDKFSVTLTKTLDPAWNSARMNIVACLNKPFDIDHLDNCQVLNTAQSTVNDPNAIKSVTTDNRLHIIDGTIYADGYVSVEVFTTAGIRVANSGLASGLYLIRATDASGNSTVIKSYIK